MPGVDLEDYKATLIERFSNPEVRDTVARLCAESSDRIPKWLLPVVRHNLEHDGEIGRSAAVVASWARYAEGDRRAGRADRGRRPAQGPRHRQRARTGAFIEDRELFGDLADNHRFRAAYDEALDSLHEHGARTTLERYQSV